MPKRGPKCKVGSSRMLHLILWVRDTRVPWKGLPVPHDAQGKPSLHDTTVDTVCATWDDAGSLWQACVARVRSLVAEPYLATSLLHGEGTTTVAQKGARVLGMRGTKPEGCARHRDHG
jgi:hypothetical protein